MNPDFESHKSPWVIHISSNELIEVNSAVGLLGRRESDSSVVWLTKVENGPRLWIIRDGVVCTWFSMEGAKSDPLFALPIPDRFVSLMCDLARGELGLDLYCNEVEGTIIARAGDRYIAIDHPKDVEFTELDLPYISHPYGHHSQHAVAELSFMDLHMFSDITHDIPRHAFNDMNRVLPFVKVAIGDGMFSWTIDWRPFGLGRTTGAVKAITTGNTSFTFYPYPLARLLRVHDAIQTSRVFIEGDDSEYVYFVGPDWGIRVVCDREELARWHSSLHEQLDCMEIEYEHWDGERLPQSIAITVDNKPCFVSIHVSEDNNTEFVRLTHIASRNVAETGQLLQQLNSLNHTLTGVRVVLRNGDVRIITEFPASAMSEFPSHMAVFRHALTQCSGLDAFLPLFSQS